jgi:hypothetical protein
MKDNTTNQTVQIDNATYGHIDKFVDYTVRDFIDELIEETKEKTGIDDDEAIYKVIVDTFKQMI